MSTKEKNIIPRATGLLVIAVENVNPNGDPDRESDPRQRSHDRRGYISGVSFKRKLRDLIELKDGPIWQHMKKKLAINNDDSFCILESRERGFSDVKDASEAWRKILKLIDQGNNGSEVANKYWDARIFGATFLEKGEEASKTGSSTVRDRKYIRTGVAQFGIAVSVAPVRIHRDTNTKKTSAQESKERGMAPLACRYVEHGIYCMPFFVNPTAAIQSGCTLKDIALLLSMIKHAYPNTRSAARGHGLIEVVHAWYAEHEDQLGSFSEFELIEKLTPRRKGGDREMPSVSGILLNDQYEVPDKVPSDFRGKLKNGKLYDLCVELPEWCSSIKGDGKNGK
ncbi:MAG: type I CRISPR-associated protein Cas7 [Sedimentisphaerales bacterium]|nr:type I CRISPR-associated protein Cas7 [Sedimentisphaerales bacterium]